MPVRHRRSSPAVYVSVLALVTPMWIAAAQAQTTSAQAPRAPKAGPLALPSANVPPETNSPSPRDAPTVGDGDRLAAAGDLKGALQIYRAVYFRTETGEAQRRIADTEARLGHDGYAYSEYARLLDRFGSSLPRTDRKKLEKRLKKLDDSTGLLVLDDLPANASILVDDESVPKNLRSNPLRLTRGWRRLEVEIPSHKPVRFVTMVGATPMHMALTFEPLLTTAMIRIGVRDDLPLDLYVDGKKFGPLPQQVQLPVGEHAIAADGETHFVAPRALVVETRSPTELTLEATEKPAVLEIDPSAPNAILYVDEQPLGTGPRRLELTRGKHVLELRRPGYRTQKLVLDAKPGQFNVLRAAAYVLEHGIPTSPMGTAPRPSTPRSPRPDEPQDKPTARPTSNAKVKTNSTQETDEEHAFRGFYGELFVPIMLGGASTHSYVSSCPADTYGGTCSTTAPRGGGLALKVGYFYEWIGVEAFGAGAVDVSSAQLGLPPIPSVTDDMRALAERTVFLRAGGLLGGGLRLSTPLKGIRVSLGADYLHVARKVIAIPDSFVGASLGYSAPGYFLDGGLELGSTPGTRFYLGAFLFIENAPDLVLSRDLTALGITTTVPSELTTMTVYRGRQYLFGPLLGLTFGH
ncbi:MAG: PEGA domain-containing protein [Polyangiaceae bacterium]